MTTTDQQLTALRSDIDLASRMRARAQVEYDQAQQRLTSAQTQLKSEFGVVTTEEAKAKLLGLRSAVDEAINTARTQLAEASA